MHGEKTTLTRLNVREVRVCERGERERRKEEGRERRNERNGE